MRRLTTILASLVVASATAGTAFAGKTVFSTQQANLIPLPCLNAAQRFSGVITTTSDPTTLRAKDEHGSRRIDAEFSLSFRYEPNDPSLPIYTGGQIVSVHVLLPTTQDSLTVPIALSLTGADGSAAVVSGAETLLLSDGPGRNLNVSIGDGTWNCA
jgi:hypothetical protein